MKNTSFSSISRLDIQNFAYVTPVNGLVETPVELKYTDGRVEKLTVAARNDNKGGAWTIDGGI